jgi:tetratricopeptide (TPR) repeat protein
LLSDRPVERFQQTVGKVQHRGGVEKEGDEYENKANAVAAKVAAGESAEHAPKDFSETNSGEKQSQGRDPTDPHSTSSHQAQTIVNRLDEAAKKSNLGFSLYKEVNYKDALELYKEAVDLAPNNSLYWYN